MLELILDKLGQFPIIQVAFAVVVVVGGLWALRRGERDKGTPAPPDIPETRIFFDGPVGKALDKLEGIYRETKEMRDEQGQAERDARARHEQHMEVLRDIAAAMRETALVMVARPRPRRRKRS